MVRHRIRPRRNQRAGPKSLGILWMVIIVALGLIVPAAASWQTQTPINVSVSTGNIDPIFTSAEAEPQCLSGNLSEPKITTDIDQDGKQMEISIDDAYPGYTTTIDYKICNQGSIPVRYKADTFADDGLTVTNDLEEGVLEGNGGEAEGKLHISVGDVKESELYKFDLILDFKQWNQD